MTLECFSHYCRLRGESTVIHVRPTHSPHFASSIFFLCFWCEQTLEWTFECPVIWDVLQLIWRNCSAIWAHYIDGLVQNCSNPNANANTLVQDCSNSIALALITKPSIWLSLVKSLTLLYWHHTQPTNNWYDSRRWQLRMTINITCL